MLRIRANTILSDEGDQARVFFYFLTHKFFFKLLHVISNPEKDPSLYYVVSGKLVAEQQMEVFLHFKIFFNLY